MTKIHLYIFLIYFLISNFPGYSQLYYGNKQVFGKNTMRYNNFEWNFYRFKMFDIFYYKNGNKNAQYTSYKIIEKIEKFNKIFDIQPYERIQIICYNTLTHLKQSNLNDYNDIENNKLSSLNLKDDKIILHGTGNFNDITEQINKGLTRIYIKELLNINQINSEVKNTYNIKNIPQWFIEGMTLFISLKDRQNPKVIYRIADMINEESFDQLNHNKTEDNAIIGYSIWEFINYKYGQNTLVNLWKAALSTMDIEEEFENALNKDFDEIMKDRESYFSNKYKNITKSKKNIEYILETSEYENINQISLSNDEKLLAYVINKTGEFYINILDIDKADIKTIYEGGYRIPFNEDKKMPIVKFHPQKKMLIFITEERALTKFHTYDIKSEELKTRKFLNIDRVLSINFSNKGDKVAMSAVKNGFTDIFVYNINTKVMEQINRDSYIDLNPVFLSNDQLIAFKSNRVTDSLKNSMSLALGKISFDIFIYDYKNKSKKLEISTNNGILKDKLNRLNSNNLSYLMFDKSNNQNLYSLNIDSTISHIDTVIHYKSIISNYKIYNNPLNTLNYDISKNKIINLKLQDNSNKLSIINKKLINEEVSMPKPNKQKKMTSKPKVKKKYKINIGNYKFEKDILDKFKIIKEIDKEQLTFNKNNDIIIKSKEFNEFKRLYRPLFFASKFHASLYDEFNGINYQVFTGGPTFLKDPLSGFMKLDLKDPFENYILTFAFKSDFIPVWGVSLSPNTSIGVIFHDKSSFIKHKYSVYRKSAFSVKDINTNLNIINSKIQYDLIYPFNPVSSLRFEIGFRRDEQITLSKEFNSAIKPTETSNNIFFRTSYVYDNAINFEKNIHRGLKFKIFTEIYQGFEKDRQTMFNIGLDARYYIQLHKVIILANRLASGTSLSSQKLIFYLGGTDNDYINRFNNDIPISNRQNYGFQTLMTNMRGFEQNIRNGSSFFVFNTEIRIPIFAAILNYPIQFSFLRHLQIVPFFDIGTAWTGISPWSKENEFNSLIIQKENMTITIDRQQEPIVYSFGIGLRTILFGQFIRLDYGIGVNTGELLKGLVHLSIAFDF